MTGAELKAVRHALGLSAFALGLALGYSGNRNTVQLAIRRYEHDERPIPPWIAHLAYMIGWHGVPDRWPDEQAADAAE